MECSQYFPSQPFVVLTGRGGSADTVVNVTAVEFRFGAVVLTKRLMFDKTYQKIGVAGSHLVPIATPLVCL